jgi:hypothetical protein
MPDSRMTTGESARSGGSAGDALVFGAGGAAEDAGAASASLRLPASSSQSSVTWPPSAQRTHSRQYDTHAGSVRK